MIDWNQVRLPPEAALLDRLTFVLGKWWHQRIRETLRMAYWTAFLLVVVLTSGVFLAAAVPRIHPGHRSSLCS